MAPELCEEEEYDNRVDVWSTGVIAYILLSGVPPFYGNSKEAIYQEIVHKSVDFSHPNFAKVSQEAKDFICSCLKKTYTRRPQVSDLLDHPWMKVVETQKLDESVVLDIGKSLFNF